MPLERKDTLRRAKTSEGAVRRRVCRDRTRANTYIGTVIRTGCVNRASGKHYGRECAIGAAINDELDVHRDEFALLSHRGLMTRARGMSLRGRYHVLRAVVNHLHRFA